MSIIRDIFGIPKKRCSFCGCVMYDDSESDICEVCLDEIYESDPGESEEVDNV